ncbi:unnamed protein product [Urochloa humidicola]
MQPKLSTLSKIFLCTLGVKAGSGWKQAASLHHFLKGDLAFYSGCWILITPAWKQAALLHHFHEIARQFSFLFRLLDSLILLSADHVRS